MEKKGAVYPRGALESVQRLLELTSGGGVVYLVKARVGVLEGLSRVVAVREEGLAELGVVNPPDVFLTRALRVDTEGLDGDPSLTDVRTFSFKSNLDGRVYTGNFVFSSEHRARAYARSLTAPTAEQLAEWRHRALERQRERDRKKKAADSKPDESSPPVPAVPHPAPEPAVKPMSPGELKALVLEADKAAKKTKSFMALKVEAHATRKRAEISERNRPDRDTLRFETKGRIRETARRDEVRMFYRQVENYGLTRSSSLVRNARAALDYGYSLEKIVDQLARIAAYEGGVCPPPPMFSESSEYSENY